MSIYINLSLIFIEDNYNIFLVSVEFFICQFKFKIYRSLFSTKHSSVWKFNRHFCWTWSRMDVDVFCSERALKLNNFINERWSFIGRWDSVGTIIFSFNSDLTGFVFCLYTKSFHIYSTIKQRPCEFLIICYLSIVTKRFKWCTPTEEKYTLKITMLYGIYTKK